MTTDTTTTEATAETQPAGTDRAATPNLENPVPDATDTPDETDTDDDADDIPADLRAARHEAATRRKELRTVEAERDALKGTVTALQRQVAEQLITATESLPYLHNPADLFDIGGVDVADLTDDAGGVDAGKLAAALTALQGERGYLFGPRPTPEYSLFEVMRNQTAIPAGHNPGNDSAAAWQNALKSN